MSPLILFLALLNYRMAAGVESGAAKVKSWESFRSEMGVEFKIPTCWSVIIDDPDELHQPVTKARDIVAQEGPSCARPRWDSEIPNGVGLNGWEALPTAGQLGDIIKTEKWLEFNKINRDYLLAKRFKAGTSEAFAFVEVLSSHPTKIRWQFRLYCPGRKFQLVGPSIENPSLDYIKKFKAGDLALPEPEKTIIESIRCVFPKEKSAPRGE